MASTTHDNTASPHTHTTASVAGEPATTPQSRALRANCANAPGSSITCCVCVCDRERARGRGRERKRGREGERERARERKRVRE